MALRAELNTVFWITIGFSLAVMSLRIAVGDTQCRAIVRCLSLCLPKLDLLFLLSNMSARSLAT